MAFRVGGDTFFMYLPVEGRAVRLSTGTRLLARAREIERSVKSLTARGLNDQEILGALVAKTLTPQQVHDAIVARRLDELRQQLRDTDLNPLVTDWYNALTLRDQTKDEYLATIRKFIPEGAKFPASQFTTGRLQQHFDRWTTPSRNRYRTAFSRFAEWLVAREVLRSNPVRLTHGVSENDPRLIWYTPDQAKALIRALDMPWQALEALMCGSGIDLGAALAATRNDVNEERRTVFAHGPESAGGKLKTRFRVRDCVVTEDWCWDLFWQHARRCMPAARLFPHEKHAVARHHKAAYTAAGLHASWPRDWRHTFAVTLRQRGVSDWRIAELLGHRDTSQVAQVYARFKPTPEQMDYRHMREANDDV